jgi:hypothetical protein
VSDEQWAKRTLKKFREDESKKREVNAAFVEQQKIRRASLDRLWEQIRIALDKESKKINAEAEQELITLEIITSTNIQLRRNEPTSKKLMIVLDPEASDLVVSIFGRTPGDLMHLTVAVEKESGTGYLAQTDPGKADTLKRLEPMEIARSMIEETLRING